MSKEKQREIQENELMSWGEEKLGHLKPYATQIALFATLALIGFMAITWFIGTQRERYSLQWRELSLASTETNLTQNSSRLLDVAESFPDQRAGVWSLQMAGDYDMRTGLSQLSYDRDGGLALIGRAKDNYAKVVEADAKIKSQDLQERSLFSLAYAHESLGEFEEAKNYYTKLVEASPDSPFASPAQRGIERCSNQDLVALYTRFKEWKIDEETAPGAPGPARPDISIPDFDVDGATDDSAKETLGAGGGDFEEGADPAPQQTDDQKKSETDESGGGENGSGETGQDSGSSNDENNNQKKSDGDGDNTEPGKGNEDQ